MRGIVIHIGGRVRRSIEGRGGTGRLSVIPIRRAGITPSEINSRPIRYVFYDGDRQLATSTRVVLTKGRRYPGIEHWFVLPETERRADLYESSPETSALTSAMA